MALGSSLGPALANIFAGVYETKLFSNANKPQMYHRYVDDTFVAFNSEKKCNGFFISLNSIHPSLRFIFEKEFNDSLPFLDEKSEAEFITSVYRSIFTIELFLSF